MSGKNDCSTAASEESVFAEYASKDDAFGFLVQRTKDVVKDGYGLSSVDSTSNSLYSN